MSGSVTGTSIAWRPAIADTLTHLAAVGRLQFTEVVAENLTPGALPAPLTALRDQGIVVIPHGVGLGLAGAELPDPERLMRLGGLARELGSPMVSEHVAFVRASRTPDPMHGDVLEAGHLLPAARTADGLAVLCDNISRAQDQLDVPLALENIAALITWPEDEYDEADFLTELVRRTGVKLVLDVANLYASAVAGGGDPVTALGRFPLADIAYVHTAGGRYRAGRYLDTHCDPIVVDVMDLLAVYVDCCHGMGIPVPGIMLERDDDISAEAVLSDLRGIDEVLMRGGAHVAADHA